MTLQTPLCQVSSADGFAQSTLVGAVSVGPINGGVSQQQLVMVPPAMGLNWMMRIA